VTRIVCAIALFMLGFAAHADARPINGPFSTEYQLPDGTFASMCLPSEEHGKSHTDDKHCDTCIMSTAHLFTPPDTVELVAQASLQGDVVRPESNANPRRILSHHGQSRGPPLNA
jgi:hypothetical protein